MSPIETFRAETTRQLTTAAELAAEAFLTVRLMKLEPRKHLNADSVARLRELARYTRRLRNEAELEMHAATDAHLRDWYANRTSRLEHHACQASRAHRLGIFMLDPNPDTMDAAYGWHGPEAIQEAQRRLDSITQETADA